MRNFVRNILCRWQRRIRHSSLRFSLSLSLSLSLSVYLSFSQPHLFLCVFPANLPPLSVPRTAVYLIYFFDFERRRANKLQDHQRKRNNEIQPLLTAARLDNMENIVVSLKVPTSTEMNLFERLRNECMCFNELLMHRMLLGFLLMRELLPS